MHRLLIFNFCTICTICTLVQKCGGFFTFHFCYVATLVIIHKKILPNFGFRIDMKVENMLRIILYFGYLLCDDMFVKNLPQ